MSGQEEMWVSHTIAAIGLSLNVFQPWPLLSMSDVGAAGIYQPIGDTNGIVFVSYGPEETVDKYIEKLGGMFTAVSVVSDTTVTVAGREARRVTLRMVTQPREMYRDELGRGIRHKTLPEARTLLSVIGFSNRGIPILVGYRVPEESLGQYKERLEAILMSTSVS